MEYALEWGEISTRGKASAAFLPYMERFTISCSLLLCAGAEPAEHYPRAGTYSVRLLIKANPFLFFLHSALPGALLLFASPSSAPSSSMAA